MSSVGPLPSRAPVGARMEAAIRAAGSTDPGTQREVNEDRFHSHPERGLFIVIDGVGGQAAGGRAADVALSLLRERLERETGPVTERIREGITIANNEILRLASTRAEWAGMACVLTVAVVNGGAVTFGHVGDTRLYKLRGGHIDKLTRDHSPVGEREDANEISELQAMRHPRRNEVYRDVGSEPHGPGDDDFIDVGQVPFEDDAALLLCSDGLTDLVDSATIARTVHDFAGDPDAVVQELVAAANAAGGKDNITAVYVEGERFAVVQAASRPPAGPPAAPERSRRGSAAAGRRRLIRLAMVALVAAVAGVVLIRTYSPELGAWLAPRSTPPTGNTPQRLIVTADGSIAAALRDAPAGSEIVVEPGEYREQVALKAGVRLISRIPRAAAIRLPAAIRDGEEVPAVIARDAGGAELAGFTISGDSATPLAIGIFVEDSAVSIVDVEITGATNAAVEFSGAGSSMLIGSDIRDNPGAAIVVRNGAAPRISHNTLLRNSTSERTPTVLLVDGGSSPTFVSNVFVTANANSYATLGAAAYAALRRENWFVSVPPKPQTRAPAPGGSSPRR